MLQLHAYPKCRCQHNHYPLYDRYAHSSCLSYKLSFKLSLQLAGCQKNEFYENFTYVYMQLQLNCNMQNDI